MASMKLRLCGPFRVCVAASLLGATGPRVAHADERDQPVRIDYQAPSACPTEDEFLARLRAHARRARRTQDTQPARTIVVTIVEGDRQVRVHVVIREPAGGESARDVDGETCEEVVAALALITALT